MVRALIGEWKMEKNRNRIQFGDLSLETCIKQCVGAICRARGFYYNRDKNSQFTAEETRAFFSGLFASESDQHIKKYFVVTDENQMKFIIDTQLFGDCFKKMIFVLGTVKGRCESICMYPEADSKPLTATVAELTAE